MKFLLFLSALLLMNMAVVQAQIGGEHTYQFLELTNSARVASLGGNQSSFLDSTDLNLPFHNPALLDSHMTEKVLVNYVNYLSDINYGYASYAKSYSGIGMFALGMHYINYGKFREATEFGELTGNQFSAAEYALNLIYANRYKSIKYGVNLKPVFSAFESYRSFGIAADLGISIRSKNGLTNFAIAARNLGTQITTYYNEGSREKIPFNLQAGISKRLQHAPVVLYVNFHQLNNWDLSIPEEKESGDQNGMNIFERNESFLKQAMRHTIFGVEILPSENFILRFGYNYQRRQELKFEDKASTVGLSAGFGLKLKRFRLDYGISRFHLAGSSNLFSLTFNIHD